ncbi:L,D-transpeptidase [Xanthobacter agilis]|uniref:Lipoprotein-anchoring transpeptidase ErfK/SrfK n=1 Tax=Xanthobacter agilis TaxID=47492 RepID=A0ABU0LCT8_XANAG|nr:L,D-transpeptidase [Xanthobacter agilis]MDQ0504950.1 lipoprotein-anchoring transpeptidase ErfK/SrfK [Xanthobacter agilis]
MMHLKAIAAVAIAAALVSAGHARADDRYELFPFAKLFLTTPSDVGVASGSSPIPRQMVSFDKKYKPGTIVISTPERRLYYVTAPGQAIRYGVGVGRDGFQWSGVKTISAKREWPGWTPPAQMLKRRPDLPRYMPGGLDNPLGARAMYLGSSLYRIHGSNEPETIGQAVSSGCIRMTNDDVVDLYGRVRVGTVVYVLR